MAIKDQIYYQAIVNLISLDKLDLIKQFCGKNVFGGYNYKDPNSIFLLAAWRNEYSLYKWNIKETFKEGYTWVGRFDLASFYDLIDHKILVEVSSCGALDKETENDFCQALKIWSQPHAIDFYHSHGIPQGPCASQVLADIYLHILDRKILGIAPKYNLKYFRYVDDIIILGKTDKDVKIGLIQLDIAARELSLIPQSNKIGIKETNDISKELKGENSIFGFSEKFGNRKISIKRQKQLKKFLLESVNKIDTDSIQIIDESNVKFALNRLLPDPDVSALVVKILKSYSHITSSCVNYLNQDKLDQYISEEILTIIKDKPIHDWHTSQLLRLSKNLQELHILELNSILLSLLSDPYTHWILKRESIDTIKCSLDKTSIFVLLLDEFKKNLNENKASVFLPYIILLFRACLELDFNLSIDCLTNCVYSDQSKPLPDEIYIYLAYYSTFHKKDLPDWLKRHSWTKTYLSPVSMNDLDGISHHLVHFYDLSIGLKFKVDFRDYLERDEYELALNYLCQAFASFEKEPNLYFDNCDCFNQIMLVNVYKRDGVENIPKYEHGNMIDKLKKHIPAVFSAFNECHKLRCDNPRIHAYNSTGTSVNKKSSNLFSSKKAFLRRSLSSAYEALLEYISEHHIHKLGGF